MKRIWKWLKSLTGRTGQTGRTSQTVRRGFEVARLRERLAALPVDDPLWPELMLMLDAYLLSETVAAVTPGIGDAEANRFRGRQGMLLDLRADLEKVWREAHSPAES